MTALAVQSPVWTWRRWCLLIALTFLMQVGLIFVLGDKVRPHVQRAIPAPKVSVIGNPSSELIALTDPTLFALPHQVGFSGPGWMKIPPVTNSLAVLRHAGGTVPSSPFEWTEESPLPIGRLGTSPLGLHPANQPELLMPFVAFEPESTPSDSSFAPAFRQKSEFRLAAGLQQRRLKNTFKLPSWPNSDFLTNTIVKLFINADGVPISVPVLLSPSGLKAADDYALAQAATARFEPIINEGPGRSAKPLANSTWGTIIFEWRTLPTSATNAGSPSP